jgi:hypothetical protein
MPHTAKHASAEAIVDLPIPIPAVIHRVRRSKREAAIVLVRRPAPLPFVEPDTAPLAASLRLPRAKPAEGWAAYPSAFSVPWIRFDGTGFCRPLVMPGGGVATVAGLADRIARFAAGEEHWSEWPYAIDKRRFGTLKPNLVEAEGLNLQSSSVNFPSAHADAARELASRLCLVGDELHVACKEPVLDVVVRGLSKNRLTRVSVIPSAGGHLDPETEQDVVQTFAANRQDAAESYAVRLAERLKLPVQTGAGWETVLPVMDRDDARDAPGEGLARIAARTHGLVGRMGRPAADAWLDLRDASRTDPSAAAAADQAERLLRLLPESGSLLPSLLRWHLLRWEDEHAEDIEALGALA